MIEKSEANSTIPDPISQVCVVPFRWQGDRLEICLITSLNKQRWIFPKGIIDPGESCEETARKEALEEAGIHGQIVGEALGVYADHKWGRRLLVTVLMMEVVKCDGQWAEADVRQRRWVSPSQATQLISRPVLHEFLEIAVGRIGGRPFANRHQPRRPS